MEKIELVVTHQAGTPVARAESAVFGMAGGTIGRSGQNKLVLPDSDAEIARVHAMVRLDSDQAYIANLCERRSVQVNGLEVLSGQEVPLGHGAQIVIGSYRIIATVPGAHQRMAVPALDARDMTPEMGKKGRQQDAAPAPRLLHEGAQALNLASLPNPWADIPPIVGGEPTIPELINVQATSAQADDQSTTPLDDNPFAMLGRVENLGSSTVAASTTALAPTVGLLAPDGFDLAPKSPEPATALNPIAPAAPTCVANAPLKVPAHRAMVIPDDFDPFAADPKEAASQRDAWSGDLAAKSLAEVTQLKNDELLQSLPPTSHFAGDMDNAAHTGLPKQLDPYVELNPLRLFREPGESMYTEAEDHGLSRGSDLAQVFSMPRGTWRDAEPATSTSDPGSTHAPEGPTAKAQALSAEPRATEVAKAAGLRTMQGLDLELFGTPTLDGARPGASSGLLQSDSGESALALSDERAGLAPLSPFPAPSPFAADGSAPTRTAPDKSAARQQPLAPVSCTAANSLSPNDVQALAAAFLQGAGIAPDRAPLAITPDFMRDFGEVLRIAVQGSIDLLSARSEIKREFRADVTIIASGKNNPLKFLPTAEGVMLQLVGQNFPGFMPPVAALREAFNDLAVHQIALMAGIRAAYAEAVSSLSPAELEKTATSPSGVLAKLSSLHRKAALWDEYQRKYESIRQHAEDDLMAFSGQTFVQAYENAAQSAGGAP